MCAFFLGFPESRKHEKSDWRSVIFSVGVYGDQMNEMSWAIGEVLRTLDDLGLAEDTLVVFASDHGPQLEACSFGGSPGGLSGEFLESKEPRIKVD